MSILLNIIAVLSAQYIASFCSQSKSGLIFPEDIEGIALPDKTTAKVMHLKEL